MKNTKYYTKNLRLDYMLSQQVSKDVIFNEAINKIDSILYQSVFSFIDDLSYSNPDHHERIKQLLVDDKHIIIADHDKKSPDRIYYLPYAKENISFIEVRNGMLVYVQEKGQFYLYHDQNNLSNEIFANWQPIYRNLAKNNALQVIHDNYYKIRDVDSNIDATHIMLQCSTRLDIELEHVNHLHLFIWYNSEANHKILWPEDILWNNKNHDMCKDVAVNFDQMQKTESISEDYAAPDRVTLVKLYRVPQINFNANLQNMKKYRFLGVIEDQTFII